MDPDKATPASEWPEIPHPGHTEGRERLAWWRKRRYVEGLLRKRGRGFDLAAHEEAAIAYSTFGIAGGCPATSFFLGSR